MRKLTVALTLFTATVPTAAAAADWVWVSRTDSDIDFVDQASIRTTADGYKQAWVRTEYSKPDQFGITSRKSLQEFDCRSGRLRFLQIFFYYDNGKQVAGLSNDVTNWIYAPPQSVGEDLLNFVCVGKLP